MSPSVIESNRQHETAAWNETAPCLHAEVNRLPEKYRLPVILSYLEGRPTKRSRSFLQCRSGL